MLGSNSIRRLAAWMLFSALPLCGVAQSISQPAGTFGVSGSLAIGQSFTATTTGHVVSIDVRGWSGWVSTLRLYNGGTGSGAFGVVGTPAYSQPGVTITAVASGGAFSHITLTTPFPIVSGRTYTFSLDGASQSLWATGNVYPGGRTIVNYGFPDTLDLAFQISQAASADLEVSQTASSTAATVGSTISYTVTIRNAGSLLATSITVADNLSAAGLVLLSAQSSVGVLTTSSNALSLAIGALAAGANETLTLIASVSAGAGSITHTVAIGSSSADPNASNDAATHFASRLAAPPSPVTTPAIPTLGEWAMLALAGLLVGLASGRLRTRSP